MKTTRSLTTRAHFDGIAEVYYEFVDTTPLFLGYYHWREKQVIEQLLSNLHGAKMKVLDVGCGPGRYAKIFNKKGETSYTGIDFSPKMIEIARRVDYSEKIEFGIGSITWIPFRPSTFDVTFSLEVLEHLPRKPQSITKAVKELLAATKSGGIVIIEAPSPSHYTIDYLIRRFLRKIGEIRGIDGLRDILPTRKFEEYYVTNPLTVDEPIRISSILGELQSRNMKVLKIVWIRIIPETFYLILPTAICKILHNLDLFLEKIPILKTLGREYIIICQKVK